jgi:hypothetical protein
MKYYFGVQQVLTVARVPSNRSISDGLYHGRSYQRPSGFQPSIMAAPLAVLFANTDSLRRPVEPPSVLSLSFSAIYFRLASPGTLKIVTVPHLHAPWASRNLHKPA